MKHVSAEDTKLEDILLFSLNDLIGFSAEGKDFDASVVDVFLERDTWKISHLVLDTGGALEHRVVVVPGSAVSEIIPSARKVKVDLKGDITKAVQSLEQASLLEGGDVSVLPKLIFGADRDALADAFFSEVGARDHYVSVSEAASCTAVNGEGEIGSMIGFIADADKMVASHITVDTGVNVPKSQHALPVSLVKEIGTADRRTVLAVDKEKLSDSPTLEHFDGLDRHWIDKVASYYGLT